MGDAGGGSVCRHRRPRPRSIRGCAGIAGDDQAALHDRGWKGGVQKGSMTPRAFSSVALVLAGLCTALTPGHGQQLTFLNRDLKQIESWAREDTNDFQREYYLALAHWKRRHWREADSLLRFSPPMEPPRPEGYLALAGPPDSRPRKVGGEGG